MSFRNIRGNKKSSFEVLRSKPKRMIKDNSWQDQYQRLYKRTNYAGEIVWIPIVVGVVAAIAGAVGGFFVGQKYSYINVAKDVTETFIPKEVRQMLPKSIRKFIT